MTASGVIWHGAMETPHRTRHPAVAAAPRLAARHGDEVRLDTSARDPAQAG
jgi:hypothetical protein